MAQARRSNMKPAIFLIERPGAPSEVGAHALSGIPIALLDSSELPARRNQPRPGPR
jgi:hypothetical protein